MSMRLAPIILLYLVIMPSTASASRIFDVVTKYRDDVSVEYVYSFTMTFNSVKDVYYDEDLVGGGFTQEAFEASGDDPWLLIADGSDDLRFTFKPDDPLTLNFRSFDEFGAPDGRRVAVTITGTGFRVLDLSLGEEVSTTPFTLGRVVSVTERGSQVPAPAALSLLGLGLAGMLAVRRRATKKEFPPALQHDTSAANV